MSYRHPRFYKEDYGSFGKAFQKNFDTQFNNVMDYYEQQGAARKEYENDLFAQADKMREDAKAAGATAADLKGKIEDQVQAFLKEGLEVKGLDKPGFLGMNIKETGKKNRLQLDEANASFNANIEAANQITDRAFVSGLQVDDDYDHGSGSYLEYASVVKSLQNQQGTADFAYSGDNKFSFGVEIDNPRYDPELPVNDNQYLEDGKTRNPDYNPKKLKYNAEEVQRLIGENDPEARKQIEENINTATDTLLKTAKSDLEAKFAQGNAYGDPTKGKAYLGETAVKEVVGGYMQELQQQDENNPDEGSIIDDIYNNKIKFNDKTRMEIFQGVEGSDFLLNKISKDGSINPELADEMSMLLDLPKNDITYQRRILKKLGVTEPADVKKAMNSINAAKDGMVERYLINEVYGSGITSKYIKPQIPKESGPSGGSGGYNANDEYTIMQGKKAAEVSINTVKAIGTFGADIPAVGIRIENGERVYTNPAAGELVSQDTENNFVEEFLNAEFTFGGSKKNASGFEMGRDGRVVLTFDGPIKQRDVMGTREMYDAGEIRKSQIGKKVDTEDYKSQDSTLEYNVYEPESMRNFFDATSTEAGGTGEYSRGFKSTGYNVQMVRNFTSPVGLESLNNPKMGEWLAFVDEKGGHKTLIDHAVNNPEIFEQGTQHWADFYKKYEDEINAAIIKKRRSNL